MSSTAESPLIRDRYLAAQLAGNREALRVIIEEGSERGLTPSNLQKVIQEAQREIGRLWQDDRITIAQVHMATNADLLSARERGLSGKLGATA